jgi:DNA-binding MarR family transcriptional regulator
VSAGSRGDLTAQINDARDRWSGGGWSDTAPAVGAVTSVLRAQRLYVQMADRILKSRGLNASRFEVLTVLHLSARRVLPFSVLKRQLQLQPSSITNTIDKLERDKLVIREATTVDRRQVVVRLTEHGQAIAIEAVEEMNARLFAALGIAAAEFDQLIQLVANLCERLATVSGGKPGG